MPRQSPNAKHSCHRKIPWGLLGVLLGAWMLCPMTVAARVDSPVKLERGVARAALLNNGELAQRLTRASGDEEIFLRFVLLRRAANAGDGHAVTEQCARLLEAASDSGDEATQNAVYAALGDTLSTVAGEDNRRLYHQHAQGQLIAAEAIRQRMENIQHNQKIQLEYMARRAEMQRRITLLLGVCLALTAALAWTLWRIARSRRAQAMEDAMTGLKNRRFLQAFMGQETLRLQRSGETTLLLIADLDHFKRINDRWGHDMGDRVLVRVAQTLRGCMRNSDVVVRWGGEEFVVVCPQSREMDAELICQRIRKRLRETQFADGEGQNLRVSISIGAALFEPARTGEPWERVLERADRSLYWVKQHGRDNWRLAEVQAQATAQAAVS